MATIAGTVMVLYATTLNNIIPGIMGHLLTASLISAPAAITISKLMIPETEAPSTGTVELPRQAEGSMDAITKGTLEGVKLLINIIAMLVVLVALVYLLNLILGLDSAKDRSNASGKSSFLETVPFALFGKVNRSIMKDQIVNWRNRKNCEVSIAFHKGKDEYLMYRALKPDKLEVIKNGNPLPIDAKKLEFQKQLEEEVLGIDFNTFMSLIYTNINSTVPVLTMKTPEKRKFLESIFNLQLFNKVNDKGNEKLRSIDSKIHDAKMTREFNEKSIKASNENISQMISKISGLASSKSELEDAKERLEKFIIISQLK